MKKNEKIIIGAIFVVAVIVCMAMYLMNSNESESIQIYHGGQLILEIDASVDDIYTIDGDYGKMQVEVLDGRVRVSEVECPNHICESMGWIDADDIMPISCIPNNILVKFKGPAS